MQFHGACSTVLRFYSVLVVSCLRCSQAAFRVYDKLEAFEEFEYGYTLKVRGGLLLHVAGSTVARSDHGLHGPPLVTRRVDQ